MARTEPMPQRSSRGSAGWRSHLTMATTSQTRVPRTRTRATRSQRFVRRLRSPTGDVSLPTSAIGWRTGHEQRRQRCGNHLTTISSPDDVPPRLKLPVAQQDVALEPRRRSRPGRHRCRAGPRGRGPVRAPTPTRRLLTGWPGSSRRSPRDRSLAGFTPRDRSRPPRAPRRVRSRSAARVRRTRRPTHRRSTRRRPRR